MQERIAGPHLLFGFLLIGDLHLTAERAGKKDPPPYLLTVEQMIESDYPVPSYLADGFKKSDGWIETPRAATGVVSEAQTVYTIGWEMVSTPHRVRNP